MREHEGVVIVGGGLVGALLASVLVRRGHAVTVVERRPDLRSREAVGGRSINLVLTRRGIRALERVGLEDGAMALTVAVRGRRMHALDGSTTFQPYGRDDRECNYSISRTELNRYLVDAAEARGVRFRFRTALVAADLDAGRLTFHDEADDRTVEIDSDVVFGADGAGSAVREAFARSGDFEHSVDMLSHGYKELIIPADADGGYRIEKHALHIWPRGDRMLMALPNRDGSFTVTLYLAMTGPGGFDTITDGDDVRALFEELFPDAVPWIPDLETSWFENPTGTLGTVRCRPWHRGGRAVLLGDAAHAIVPFFGQGMNSGFEDCRVLDDLLDRHGDDAWDEVFPAFTRARKPNADAIAAMALDNFVEMSERVGDERFLLRKAVEHRLEEIAPTTYRSRYSMVMYSHVPFALCRQAGAVQAALLDELCAGLERADDLDEARALAAVRARFTPFVQAHDISLDY